MLRDPKNIGILRTNLNPRRIVLNFEKLETWQKAITFADLVYETTRSFPDGERFGLTSQMRRAACCMRSSTSRFCSKL